MYDALRLSCSGPSVALLLPTTCRAVALSVVSPVQRVAVLAVRLGELPGTVDFSRKPATSVLSVRHRLEVVRVHAKRLAAQVVDLGSLRNRTNQQLVGEAVGTHKATARPTDRQHAVVKVATAAVGDRTFPHPAPAKLRTIARLRAALLVDLAPEALFRGAPRAQGTGPARVSVLPLSLVVPIAEAACAHGPGAPLDRAFPRPRPGGPSTRQRVAMSLKAFSVGGTQAGRASRRCAAIDGARAARRRRERAACLWVPVLPPSLPVSRAPTARDQGTATVRYLASVSDAERIPR